MAYAHWLWRHDIGGWGVRTHTHLSCISHKVHHRRCCAIDVDPQQKRNKCYLKSTRWITWDGRTFARIYTYNSPAVVHVCVNMHLMAHTPFRRRRLPMLPLESNRHCTLQVNGTNRSCMHTHTHTSISTMTSSMGGCDDALAMRRAPSARNVVAVAPYAHTNSPRRVKRERRECGAVRGEWVQRGWCLSVRALMSECYCDSARALSCSSKPNMGHQDTHTLKSIPYSVNPPANHTRKSLTTCRQHVCYWCVAHRAT